MLISAWAAVESKLCLLMAFLLRAPPWHVATAFYAIVNNSGRLEMLRASGTHMVGADRFQSPLNQLLDRARSLADKRNGYAHKPWVVSTDMRDVFILENHGSPAKVEKRKVHPKEMLDIANQIIELADDISAFCGEYAHAYPLRNLLLDENDVPPALRDKLMPLLRGHNPGNGRRQ